MEGWWVVKLKEMKGLGFSLINETMCGWREGEMRAKKGRKGFGFVV